MGKIENLKKVIYNGGRSDEQERTFRFKRED